jgi:hypothetical protein
MHLTVVTDSHGKIVAAAVSPSMTPRFMLAPRQGQRVFNVDVPPDFSGPESLLRLHERYILEEKGGQARLVRRAEGGD